MDEIILEVKSISKTFPGVKALDNVSLSFKKGKIHAIIGENGAGKSTLIKILTGKFGPDEGKIILKGKEVFFKSTFEAQCKGIAAVYQEPASVPYMTVAENIFLGQWRRFFNGLAVDKKQLQLEAKEILDSIGMGYLNLNTLVKHLRASEKKWVDIARVISIDPEIIIFDEPTAPLSEVESKQLFKIIADFKNKGRTILYISHRLEEIFRISDTVSILKDGRVVGIRETSEVTYDDVVKMMVGREVSTVFPKSPEEISPEKALSIRNLSSKSFLKGVSLDLYRGEILGIAGLKGQGQNVLLRILFGIIPKDKGEIYIEGEKVEIRSPKDAIKKGIVLLSEKRNEEGLCLSQPVQHNLALSSLNDRQIWGFIRAREEKAITEQIVRKLKIRVPSVLTKVEYLSGGNRQKVVIGKWMATQARILMFEEPTLGIDVSTKMEIYHLLRQLANSGKSILMVSSDMIELLGMSDRIVVMYKGSIVQEFKKEEATEEKILRASIGGVV